MPLEDMAFADWKKVVDINLTGVFLCTQAAIKIMNGKFPVADGLSTMARFRPMRQGQLHRLYSDKTWSTGITRSTSLDCRKYDIACGQIDIGNAETEMAQKMKKGVPQANGTIAVEPTMDVSAVSKAVLYMASLPFDANVLFLTVMATTMPFVGRG